MESQEEVRRFLLLLLGFKQRGEVSQVARTLARSLEPQLRQVVPADVPLAWDGPLSKLEHGAYKNVEDLVAQLQDAMDKAVELQLQGKAGQAPPQPPAANGQGGDPSSSAAAEAAVQAATLANPHAQQAALAAFHANQALQTAWAQAQALQSAGVQPPPELLQQLQLKQIAAQAAKQAAEQAAMHAHMQAKAAVEKQAQEQAEAAAAHSRRLRQLSGMRSNVCAELQDAIDEIVRQRLEAISRAASHEYSTARVELHLNLPPELCGIPENVPGQPLPLAVQHNREPYFGATTWRKTPFPPRQYTPITSYAIRSSVPTECQVLAHKLRTRRPDGAAEHFTLEHGAELGLEECKQKEASLAEAVAARRPLVMGEHVIEVDCWGMDCYTRKNIFDAVRESGAFASMRTDGVPAGAAATAAPPGAAGASAADPASAPGAGQGAAAADGAGEAGSSAAAAAEGAAAAAGGGAEATGAAGGLAAPEANGTGHPHKPDPDAPGAGAGAAPDVKAEGGELVVKQEALDAASQVGEAAGAVQVPVAGAVQAPAAGAVQAPAAGGEHVPAAGGAPGAAGAAGCADAAAAQAGCSGAAGHGGPSAAQADGLVVVKYDEEGPAAATANGGPHPHTDGSRAPHGEPAQAPMPSAPTPPAFTTSAEGGEGSKGAGEDDDESEEEEEESSEEEEPTKRGRGRGRRRTTGLFRQPAAPAATDPLANLPPPPPPPDPGEAAAIHDWIDRKVLCTAIAKGQEGWNLLKIMERVVTEARHDGDDTSVQAATAVVARLKHIGWNYFRLHPKGRGVVCNVPGGLPAFSFVEEYLGELHSPWRWFEIQDAIKKLTQQELPDFYNITLERPRDDPDGYDVMFVEAAFMASFASRMSHSCTPNCQAVVVSVGGRLTIAMYAKRRIEYGEELTFDYSSVTESEKEYREAVCLCGTRHCRGSYLYYSGSTAFTQIMEQQHNFLHRQALLVRAAAEPVNEADRQRLTAHSLGPTSLGDDTPGNNRAPEWLVKWAALVLEYVELERTLLPGVLLQLPAHLGRYDERSARIEAEAIAHNRVQQIAITLDKVKNFLRAPGQPQTPLMRLLTDGEVLSYLWTGSNSVAKKVVKAAAGFLCSGGMLLQQFYALWSNSGGGAGPGPGQQRRSAGLTPEGSDTEAEGGGRGGARPGEEDSLADALPERLLRFAQQSNVQRERPEVAALCRHLAQPASSPAEARQLLLGLEALFRDMDCNAPDTRLRGMHTAAADMLHMYACTLTWFTAERHYKGFASPPVELHDEMLKLHRVLGVPGAGGGGGRGGGRRGGRGGGRGRGRQSSARAHRDSDADTSADDTPVEEPDSEDERKRARRRASGKAAASAGVVVSTPPARSRGVDPSVLSKRYGPMFMWGQLSGWYKQTVYDPTASLSAERRGTLSLPDIESCYSGTSFTQPRYTPQHRASVIKHLEQCPDAQWKTSLPFNFKNETKVYGSPMFDQVYLRAIGQPELDPLPGVIQHLRGARTPHEPLGGRGKGGSKGGAKGKKQ